MLEIFFGTLLGSFGGVTASLGLLSYLFNKEMKRIDKEAKETFEKTFKPLLNMEIKYVD